jgi:hypothetical protein
MTLTGWPALGEFLPIWPFFPLGSFKNTKTALILDYFLTRKKWTFNFDIWATFWAIFWQTHQVTLDVDTFPKFLRYLHTVPSVSERPGSSDEGMSPKC